MCGKIIKLVIKNLNNIIYQFIGNNANSSVDNNNSNVMNNINAIIEQIYSTILPKYINSFYKRISNIFEEKKDKKINLDYSLDNLYLSFYLIIEIISEKDSNKNYSDILSSK